MAAETLFSWSLFQRTPIIGILRGASPDECRRVAEVCAVADFHTLEVTMNTPGATDIIADLVSSFPELNIGAGTVCNLDDFEDAVAAGARFIVTPVLDEDVIVAAVAQDLPVFPGAFTPTEIYRAWSLGATAVKLFPAGQLGPAYMRDVLSPLNEVRMLPTGGVSKKNIREWFAAGATGVGMGSSLLDAELIRQKDYAGLRRHLQSVKAEIADLLGQ
ncbi:2-dehydro-3-deoxyphosphogluconate aldolase/(4S)-4-hydroxy-2-oxoglutarate aldolase [Lewinella marina]|uniref:2-dehydro-3-deoxyphosphogluconate aldolase n=1 Tax=Neolewinella marina TaxID=438751 RepID=A0A2G0CAQ9_9BACT|nr:bifunctional 4-hydroxy-2-oxoglutarate aldolase/2-dehydro-3-deoxy-phosphogluconate aldolase [Neolewinella marina]NJB87845.1 2-dehydro-3-deoxyphosphogluconate aldolase/(4S)-4-hydroxy-2-oxoglutarate aldolase [Neolewinella marina]PHK97054.1 2-dehydro-3-deoxyphosphogluconate aldolase [Neolewinella marina]